MKKSRVSPKHKEIKHPKYNITKFPLKPSFVNELQMVQPKKGKRKSNKMSPIKKW